MGTTTLKLDWSQERIDAVRKTLQEWLDGYPVPEGMDDYPAGSPEWEVRTALADINLYRDAVAQVKASMHEHDGYAPHSHEVRADHFGVEQVKAEYEPPEYGEVDPLSPDRWSS